MTDELWKEWHGLLNDVRISQRYHDRRELFFGRLSRGATGVSLLMGSASIGAAVKQDPFWGTIAGAVTTLVSTLNLVVGSSDLSKTHRDLKRRFIDLEAKMIIAEVDDKAVQVFTEARLRIEADEPPVMHNLLRLCRNEVCRTLGMEQRPIGKWARLTAHILSGPDFEPMR